MRLLLDTHVFLWLNAKPDRLGETLEVLSDEHNDLFVSAASAWEIAIKWSIGKLALDEPPTSYVRDRIQVIGATALPIRVQHALAVAALEKVHADPFDRLLVAQASLSSMTIVTADAVFRRYPVELLQV